MKTIKHQVLAGTDKVFALTHKPHNSYNPRPFEVGKALVM